MIPARKGQTALEYLLIIVVAIIVVVAVYTWVSSTASDTSAKGSAGLTPLEMAAQTVGKEPFKSGQVWAVYNYKGFYGPEANKLWTCPGGFDTYNAINGVATPAECGGNCEGILIKFTGSLSGGGHIVYVKGSSGAADSRYWCVPKMRYNGPWGDSYNRWTTRTTEDWGYEIYK